MRLTMGYLISCVAGGGGGTSVVVVDWEGNYVRQEAATAAELMLEAPGHLVASAEEAGRSRRAIPMRADEALSPGGVYLLFPAGRAGSRVPDQQMAAVDRARREGKRRGGGLRKSRRPDAGGRVFPALMPCDGDGEDDGEEGNRKGGDTKLVLLGEKSDDGGFPGCRGARPWRPVLETIDEST